MNTTTPRPISGPSGADRLFPQYRPYQPPKDSLRARMEAAVERLLAMMDAMDADPDLEPDVDRENSLGWSESEGRDGWLGLPSEDAEYDLGAPENICQTRWSGHIDPTRWLAAEGEEECEDEGAACEDEGFECDREQPTEDGQAVEYLLLADGTPDHTRPSRGW